MVNNRLNSAYLYLIFLISPFFSLLIGSQTYKNKFFANLIWFFCAFAGYTFIIGNASSDINRYREKFISHNKTEITITDFIKDTIDKDDFDFLQPTISFVTSRFTDDFDIFMLIIGSIYGFFFSRNLWMIFNYPNSSVNRYNFLFIIVFSLVFAFWSINIMKFTLAAHIFFYGWLFLNIKQNKIGYFFLLLSILFHFSFTIIVILSLARIFIISKHLKYYFIFYIISFFVSEISVNSFNKQLSFIPEVFQSKSEAYLAEDYAERRKESHEEKNFRGKYYQDSLKYGVLIILVYLFLIRKRFVDNDFITQLLAFCFLSLGIFNILDVIPSMNRFLFVAYLFVMVLFYLVYQTKLNYKDKSALFLAYPFMFFFLIVKIRIGFEFTSLLTYLGGPISTIFVDETIPLIDFLK